MIALFLNVMPLLQSLVSRACKQGIKSKGVAIKCCKEKITSRPNEWANIPCFLKGQANIVNYLEAGKATIRSGARTDKSAKVKVFLPLISDFHVLAKNFECFLFPLLPATSLSE